MKTFEKIKLSAVALLLMAGTSSCLKSSDPDFGLAVSLGYIEQIGSGESARFRPALQMYGNQPINTSMGKTTCKFEEQTYMFQAVKGSSDAIIELSPSMSTTVDTVKAWACSVTATSKMEEPEVTAASFSFNPEKELGAFSVESLEYNQADGKVTGVWNKVENAEQYILVYRPASDRIWLPVDDFTVVEKDGKITANAEFKNLQDGAVVQIAVAASNGTFWSIDGAKSITGETGNKQ